MNNKFKNTIPLGTILKGKAYRYEIIKVLGQGSFGITYLASIKMTGDLGNLDAFVAIKEFFMSEINGRDDLTVTTSNKAGLFDKYKQKFIKEAKSLGTLKHPNIVKVLESFETNNTVYYAMDFIEGGSLEEYIAQRGALSEDETLRISNQIIDALSYMHSKQMLHLDLKPSNIIMSHGNPILIDFGLAKQYDNEGNPESSTTIGAGTPGYAPLEQSNYSDESAKAKVLAVTMDIYALGATMFKMLTGRRPPLASDVLNIGFPRQDLQSKQISESMQDIVQHLMSPLWKDRPLNDDAVKILMDRAANCQEGTAIFDNEEVVSVDKPAKPTPVREASTNSKPAKKKIVLLWIGASLAAIVVVIILGFIQGWFGSSSYNGPSDATDSTASSELIANGPDITYSVTGNSEFGSDNSQLCATIDGEKVVIGSISYIFGPDNMGNMNLFAQEDFNGDGIKDALVFDANMGTVGGTTWAFITYAGNNTFEKSDLFSEASFYNAEISTVDGQKVLDFIRNDMGQRIVKERHGLKNGNVVTLPLPKSKTQAYSPIKTVNMDDLGETGSFSFDLNGDGRNETIKSMGTYHFGRDFSFSMNGKEYEFSIETLWGAGTLHILKSKTKGMHDIIAEQETRLIYKWDGTTYTSEQERFY